MDELAGPYFEQVPNDPYSGHPYRYYPDGLQLPITNISSLSYVPRYNAYAYFDNWMYPTIFADTPKPILWGTSEGVYDSRPDAKFILARYLVWNDRRQDERYPKWRRPDSLQDLLSHGHYFLVP